MMEEWRNLFYYSKGERRALAVLSLLIIGIWIALWVSEPNDSCKTIHIIQENQIDTILQAKEPQHPKANIKAKTEHSKPTAKPKEQREFHTPFQQKDNYKPGNKFSAGTVVELNSVDSITLQKIPGIGPVFSKRIVKYRDLLGGYHDIKQLQEVYGMDAEKYASLTNWFRIDTTLIQSIDVNHADYRTLIRHPYINKDQTLALLRLVKRKGGIHGWQDLVLLDEFPPTEKQRLLPYLSFQ